ncbi:MAG: hypothetical protein ACM3JB_28230 [Acidobacteriaceae bacterium]
MPLAQSAVSMIVDRMPKMIAPKTHAVIDYAVAATFFTAGALFWRRHRRAALGSFLCGAAATANSLLTDYPGGVWPAMDFDTHGKIDAGLAAITSSIPSAMFFRKDRQASFFLATAIAETAVTALTDFSTPATSRATRWEERRSA